MEILMLDILMLCSMFIAERTLSAFPLEFEEHALPAERQKPLSDITLRKTSEGIGREHMLMMYGENSRSLSHEGEIRV